MKLGRIGIQTQLDVTPSWWSRHREKDYRDLCARALRRVHELPLLVAIQSSVPSLVALVRPTDEIRIEVLEEKRRAMVEELDRMEHQAEAAGEVRKPTQRLVLENVLLWGLTNALLAGDADAGFEQLQQLNQLRSSSGPMTFDVGYPHRRTAPIEVRCDNDYSVDGRIPDDSGIVITSWEADGSGDFASIQVELLRGLTIVHQTTLDRLLASKNTPPLWIPPRQNYIVHLRNNGAPTLKLSRFQMHGYIVEYDTRDFR